MSKCSSGQWVQRRAVLNGKEKLFRYMVFSKTTACSSYVQPWLVAIGGWRLVEIAGWRLAVGSWRRLAAVGGSWQLVMGGWWRLAAVDGWRLVAVGGWRLAVGGWRPLAVGGSWRLAVGGPLGRSLRAVLNKKKEKKSGPLRTALVQRDADCACALTSSNVQSCTYTHTHTHIFSTWAVLHRKAQNGRGSMSPPQQPACTQHIAP